jgi:capsule polysaccharide export protein KpsE/RkpR
MFSKDGVSPNPSKVQAIRATDPPRSVKKLNSFLCTVQYNVRFMKKFWSSTEKLRSLLKESKFNGKRSINMLEAFEDLKKRLCEETTLKYFERKVEHEVHVDGCPLGITNISNVGAKERGWSAASGPIY